MASIGTRKEITLHGRIIRYTQRVMLALLMILLAGVFGDTYNRLVIRHYRSLYSPPPGHIYSVEGYRMHMNCVGEGSPTVILESGLATDWTIWGKVQPELGKLTRVCSYDRAGYGWSDDRPGPRDAKAIADQLHALLTVADIKGPMILMGHSIAGLYLRVFLAQYPQGVTGLILLDPCAPEQARLEPPKLKEREREYLHISLRYRVMTELGIPRMRGQCDVAKASRYGEYAPWVRADNFCVPSNLSTAARELHAFAMSASEAAHTGPFGSLPLLIISHDPAKPLFPAGPEAQFESIWSSLQNSLATLSSQSRRIVAHGSSHYVQVDRPELVNAEVAQFILRIRAGLPANNPNSATIEGR